MSAREAAVRTLWRARPRDRFARASALLLLALAAGSWWLGDFEPSSLMSAESRQNVSRFLGEVVPRPLRDRDFDLGVLLEWADGILVTKGWEATWRTLAIAVAAIVLAALLSLLLCVLASRTLATPEPYLPGPKPPGLGRRALWRGVVLATRLLLIFLRAIPEYIWAFLLLAVLGPTAWPAILALALHNAGILGKLYAETIENASAMPLSAMRALGASRLQLATFGSLPSVLPRLLLYFFYRWETCVREATVLGMLGIVSLGYYIKFDARARFRYDEMMLLVLLGALLVLVGDLVSAVARRLVREAR